MRGEMCFPARGNLRLVAIGGSKLTREAIGTRRAASTKRGRRERTKLCAGTLREDARGESAQSANVGGGDGREEERGTPGARVDQGDARTDERSPGIIAAGVVRSGGHSITTQWRAYYVVSERV